MYEYEMDRWDGVPVMVGDDRLDFNVLVREPGRIRMSLWTWQSLTGQPERLACAQAKARRPGRWGIPALRAIPGNRVGVLWRECQRMVSEYADGDFTADPDALGAEVEDLRALLEEAATAVGMARAIRECASLGL